MSTFSTAMYLELIATVQKNMHDISRDHGFWDGRVNSDNVSIPTKLCLIHSEISEALEAYRKGNPPCEKTYKGHNETPVRLNMSSMAEELADAVIRIMDLCEFMKIDLGLAILDKANYNKSRPHMHGGKLC